MEFPLDGAGRSPPPAAASQKRDSRLGGYYDRLAAWTKLASLFGYGGGRAALTVHRALADPAAAGRPTVSRVHDLVLLALGTLPSGRVLDAGCGLGGTMLAFAERSDARFTGLTLSEQQAAIARRAVARANLTQRIEILVQSYDSPPEGPFNLALAIESLAHSPHPAASLAAIATRLAPQGHLVIVDDVPEPAARGTRDLASFQAGWQAPALLDARELRAALADCHLAIVAERDLSAEVRPRTLAAIARLELLNRALRRVVPSAALRATLDSYHGGLALERLYRHARMSYRLVVARKPG